MHVSVTRKTGILNVQLVEGNFVTRKHYHLKFLTLKFFFFWKKQLATHKIKLLFLTHKTQPATHKVIFLNFLLVKSSSQLVTHSFQLVSYKITLLIVTKL